MVWLILWVLQRFTEYKSIEYQANNDGAKVTGSVRYTLLVSNILEMIMELCLYAALIKLSYILSNFLKSFDSAEL